MEIGSVPVAAGQPSIPNGNPGGQAALAAGLGEAFGTLLRDALRVGPVAGSSFNTAPGALVDVEMSPELVDADAVRDEEVSPVAQPLGDAGSAAAAVNPAIVALVAVSPVARGTDGGPAPASQGETSVEAVGATATASTGTYQRPSAMGSYATARPRMPAHGLTGPATVTVPDPTDTPPAPGEAAPPARSGVASSEEAESGKGDVPATGIGDAPAQPEVASAGQLEATTGIRASTGTERSLRPGGPDLSRVEVSGASATPATGHNLGASPATPAAATGYTLPASTPRSSGTVEAPRDAPAPDRNADAPARTGLATPPGGGIEVDATRADRAASTRREPPRDEQPARVAAAPAADGKGGGGQASASAAAPVQAREAGIQPPQSISQQGAESPGPSSSESVSPGGAGIQTEHLQTRAASPLQQASATAVDDRYQQPQLVNQISDQFQRLEYPRNSRVRIHLQPEELGSVDLSLVLKGGVLALDIQAATDHGRRLIENALPQLRSALADRGIDLGSLSLQPGRNMPDPGGSGDGGQRGAWAYSGEWSTGSGPQQRSQERGFASRAGQETPGTDSVSQRRVSSNHLVDLRV